MPTVKNGQVVKLAPSGSEPSKADEAGNEDAVGFFRQKVQRRKNLDGPKETGQKPGKAVRVEPESLRPDSEKPEARGTGMPGPIDAV